ncbi:MAG: Polysaccharide ABC transporter, permease protein [Parcubacteria group bacterium GW2011_GWD2_38_11]|nr:MAG: Polysaccharide ABC transporter, permease protein [Parcubacteria group bacterium GW2011_GWD2_38_11]
MKKHENYKELIWALAKTDFKLRYHGSVLGYLWAILKPLLMFSILNFVFSSLFNARGIGVPYYSLQLLVGIILFNFFSEGTTAGMNSLLFKFQLVTKIYVPRWTIIVAATINSALIFLMNILVIILFFALNRFVPSLEATLLFLMFIICTYIIILGFALLTSPLYVKFRDLSMIWEVLVSILFYASPIVYSLQMMPDKMQKLMLLNPMAFVIHFSKEGLINNHFSDPWKTFVFFLTIMAFFALGAFSYNKLAPRIAEEI